MYQSIIFDLDGTLIDSSRGIISATLETICILDYPKMTPDEIKSCIGPPLGKTIVERNGYEEEEIHRFNEVFRDLYKNRYLMDADIYPGMIALLTRLKGKHHLSIATNKRFDYTHTLLDNLGLSVFFDCIEGSDFEGILTKENLIEKCILSSGRARKDTVMIGDTSNDSAAAEKCGIDFIGVTYGMGFKNPKDVSYGTAAESVEDLVHLLCRI